MRSLIPVLMGLLAACNPTKAPTIEGKVVDLWGHPVEGATVMVEGQSERPLTDGEGRYEFTRNEGKFPVRAGRKGYIQAKAELEVTAESGNDGPIFKLYPKPSDPGFFVVSTNQYTKLEPTVVHIVGNELKSYQGLKTVGEAKTDRELELIFHTDLRLDEIMRLGLTLHKLSYVKEAVMPGPLSDTTVSVNLYTDGGEVPITIEPMLSRTDFRVVPKKPVEPGVYAFQTQDLLSPKDVETFRQIPEELRVVFPVEVE